MRIDYRYTMFCAVAMAMLPLLTACDYASGEAASTPDEQSSPSPEAAPPHAETAHGDAHVETADSHPGDEHGEEAGHVEGLVRLSPEHLEELNIRAVPVHEGTVDSTITLPARVVLDPGNEAHLVPRVRGIVREVNVGIGDAVKAGELMATLDSRELAGAKSDYLAAIAVLELARTTLAREDKLWKDRISAEQDYLKAKAEWQAAQIKVRTAEQQLHALGLSQKEVNAIPSAKDTTLTVYEIRAPFDAKVLQRHITLGETVGEGDDVFYIARLDPVWVMGQATERDLSRIARGQDGVVQLEAYPEEEFSGKVDYVGSVLDPNSRTIDVRVVLPNPAEKLRGGLFGRMHIFIKAHDHEPAILVPNDALQRTDQGGMVYKRVGKGEFKALAVNVLHSSEAFTEVQGELKEGDRVAAGDIFVLKSEAGKEAMGGGHGH